jgi:hypothetical protein
VNDSTGTGSRGHPDDVAHVATCRPCQERARTERADRDVDLDRVWIGVAASVWAEPSGPVERLAARLLGSPGLARALVTTPSLVLSWLLASVVVLAAGVVATASTDTPWVAVLAPALAGIGVAYAYGPGIDPAFELGRTMAISDRMVLLVRCLAVCGTDALLGLGASLLAGQALGLTVAWLLPMTAVAALALAAATLTRSANVGVAAALAAWAVVVLGGTVRTGRLSSAVELENDLFLTAAYGLATLICGALALGATSGRRMEGLKWQ